MKNKQCYSVHIRFAELIYADSYDDAFDQMMKAFEDRDGFTITGHDIIEELDQ